MNSVKCMCVQSKEGQNSTPQRQEELWKGKGMWRAGLSHFRQSSSWKLDAFASPVPRLANRHSSSRQTLGSSAFSSTFHFVMLLSQITLKRGMEILDALSTRLIRAFRRSCAV